MAYTKRLDGRKPTELRPITAKAGVIKEADGSGYFKIGNTSAYAAVYGPKELYPRFMQDPKKGILRCHYNMMPFAGMGDRVRPGPSRRSKEISMVTGNALSPVLDLSDFPNAVVDVFIELPETDAGSRCAGICAASIALADAGIIMKDMVVAVAIGIVDNTLCVDLMYEEETYPDYAKDPVENPDVADIPLAIIPSTGEISLLQMDGVITPEKLIEGLDFIKPAVEELSKVMREAVLAKYKGGKK